MELRETLLLVIFGGMMMWTIAFVSSYLHNLFQNIWPTICTWDRFCCPLFPELILDSDRAKAQMEENRQKRMRTVVFVALVIFFICAAAAIINTLNGKHRIWTLVADIVFVITYLIVCVFNARPSLVTPMACRFLYSMGMAFCILQVSPAVDRSPAEPVVSEVLMGMRILLSWAILDPCIVIPWNVLYSIASWWQYAVMWQAELACWKYGAGFFALKELICLCVVVAVGYSCAVRAAAEIQERLGATASRNECGAVTSLLRAMSDVVVKLDATRHVMEDAPKLAALLLRGSGGEPMRGAQFERFLYSDEDKQVFRGHLSEQEGCAPEVAVPVRLRLRDGISSCVTVDLYHTAIEDVVGNIVHMIGIRELQPEMESQGSPRRTSEWGEDLAPMDQYQMDATAFLDALAQSQESTVDSATVDATAVRRSCISSSDSTGGSFGETDRFPNPVMLGNTTALGSVASSVTQSPRREVQL